MLASLLFAVAGGAAPASGPPPAPLVINLLPPPCPDKPSDVEVQVCAKRSPDYRIDPGVLAGQRAREGAPMSEKERVKTVLATSCHDLPSKCQGGGTIPILPVVLKTVQAAALAIKGEDWRESFRTRPVEYEAYLAERERLRRQAEGAASGSDEKDPR